MSRFTSTALEHDSSNIVIALICCVTASPCACCVFYDIATQEKSFQGASTSWMFDFSESGMNLTVSFFSCLNTEWAEIQWKDAKRAKKNDKYEYFHVFVVSS